MILRIIFCRINVFLQQLQNPSKPYHLLCIVIYIHVEVLIFVYLRYSYFRFLSTLDRVIIINQYCIIYYNPSWTRGRTYKQYIYKYRWSSRISTDPTIETGNTVPTESTSETDVTDRAFVAVLIGDQPLTTDTAIIFQDENIVALGAGIYDVNGEILFSDINSEWWTATYNIEIDTGAEFTQIRKISMNNSDVVRSQQMNSHLLLPVGI